jgi:predicted nucleic acid-binding protein
MCETCGEAEVMQFDTDVLIWYFRGNSKAAMAIEGDPAPAISAISYMELVQGARDKRELKTLSSWCGAMGILVLPLTENIGHRATIYLEEHALKDGLAMADALIAATAMESGLALCTGNGKHFRAIKDLTLNVFRV